MNRQTELVFLALLIVDPSSTNGTALLERFDVELVQVLGEVAYGTKAGRAATDDADFGKRNCLVTWLST